ncbi:MAG: hypothetical protein ACYTGP_01130 [Planctomycetota bacterium]|jgi:hypothetical protein
MSDSTPTPELRERALSPEDVEALFDDLSLHAEDVRVLLKGGARDRATTDPVSLAEARTALAEEKTAVQVRYRFGGETWCDTLMPGHESGPTLLVRTRLD